MAEHKIYTMAEFAAQGKEPEILFWIGCAGSFDDRAQKVTAAFCKILWQAGISFAILGKEESCTGDPARRAGNEFIFQMLALQNIETLKMYGVKKIVTTCPHCLNTLKNEYPELGEVNYTVVHHTQLIMELIQEGKLNLSESKLENITYHDSCYLGRINGEYQAPRSILQAISGDVKEMPRAREKALCCGAGGAQMFKEDEAGDKRVNIERTEEAINSGATTIAVNCPFCLTMFSDGVKDLEQAEEIMVYDLAELIVQNNQL